MKRCSVLGLIICLIGCTTLQPVTVNPAVMQQRIASGPVLKRGDHVVVLTKDGKTHDFNVTSINASTIEGKRESISIDQIASIQKRTVSMGKTALAIAFPVVVAAVVVLAVCSLRGNPSSMSRASGHSGRVAQPVTPLLQPLPSPPQNSQLQRCDGPSGESDSAHVRRCAT